MGHVYNTFEKGNDRKHLRSNLTYEEATMWNFLRRYFKEQRFRRQYSVGDFILDFYSPKFRIAIEIDGEQHTHNQVYDKNRDVFIASHNIQILRFWNRDIKKNLDGVYIAIAKAVESTTRKTPPSHLR